jgi:hypothetical protein
LLCSLAKGVEHQLWTIERMQEGAAGIGFVFAPVYDAQAVIATRLLKQ